ncbi:uncharacterized protein EI90DRAFT_3045570 [Cantharellus anzutake]|uniref:uncharacterized protein n=1 Tax=Cantharellus anzutake TaxID=1750568 RepID=UPI001903ADDF|nr:uncharacterized protein EI90DRAFT_3045570 [Cantharellus anzutake]KAF8336382.1 hypothetical protein EI90DRAFT_3045570 [Cantharellus anzutake]
MQSLRCQAACDWWDEYKPQPERTPSTNWLHARAKLSHPDTDRLRRKPVIQRVFF